MGKTTRLTTNDFLERCYNKFGNRFDYSKVNYKNNQTKVCIVCQEHGEFFIRPYDFLNSPMGCPMCSHKECGIKSRKGKEQFVLEARKVHGDKYDYSKVEYINNETKVCIICPEHGEFWQTPYNHVGQKQGCPTCSGKLKMDKETFIEKARSIHGDKYDYSKVEYVDNKTKVCIICPEHGEFWQRPNNHLSGQGCSKCVRSVYDTDTFIEKSRKIHGNKYDYSKVEYVDSKTKICIVCPKHGEFWQVPGNHLAGHGCPKCTEWLLEKEISEFLIEKNIEFSFQKKFDWLGKKTLDFYLPKYSVAIECQGIQHFEPVEYFGGQEKFLFVEHNDETKQKLCSKNGIILLYYTKTKKKKVKKNIYNKENLFDDKIKLFNFIQNERNIRND